MYQNLTPECAILFVRLYLGEPIRFGTIVGGAIILLGAEMVRRATQPQLATSYPSGPSAISAASPAAERPTKHLQPSFLSGRTVTTGEDASIFRPDSSLLQLPGQRWVD
jgi:hypothetical protein